MNGWMVSGAPHHAELDDPKYHYLYEMMPQGCWQLPVRQDLASMMDVLNQQLQAPSQAPSRGEQGWVA